MSTNVWILPNDGDLCTVNMTKFKLLINISPPRTLSSISHRLKILNKDFFNNVIKINPKYKSHMLSKSLPTNV